MRDVASFLRNMRNAKGLTQTEAARGILDKDSLSLIERGIQFPHAEHFMMLLERYGILGYSLGDFFDQGNASLQELKNQILSSMRTKEFGNLPGLLFSFQSEFEGLSSAKQRHDVFSRQFLLYAKAWYYHALGGSADDFLDSCMMCLKMTQPSLNTSLHDLPDCLVQNELMIINSIACLHAQHYDTNLALNIFVQLLARQKNFEGSHPVHYHNHACLLHNAALVEFDHNPVLALSHISHSLSHFTEYGGTWFACRAWRTELQMRQSLSMDYDPTRDLWILEGMFKKFVPRHLKNTSFKDFMNEREYLELF